MCAWRSFVGIECARTMDGWAVTCLRALAAPVTGRLLQRISQALERPLYERCRHHGACAEMTSET